jgi:Flp pilus assembly CpaF family ATPase
MSRPGSCRRQAEALRRRRCARANILVAGGTSTGKTTLTNALLAEVAKTDDRVVLIEDTRELQCAAPNLVAMRTKDGVASLSDLVRSSLRLRPDRIPIGEVRGARRSTSESLGHRPSRRRRHHPCRHPRIGALRRMEQLIQEAVVTVPRALIAETIDLVAVLVRPRFRAPARRTRPRRPGSARRRLPRPPHPPQTPKENPHDPHASRPLYPPPPRC